MTYSPLKITGNSTGLVQEREEFLLPDDAYPVLQNAYVWRERIRRKQGCQLLGRLQRNFIASSLGDGPSSFIFKFNFDTTVIPNITEINSELIPGSVIITDGTDTWTDQGNGILQRQDGNTNSTINYVTSIVSLRRTSNLPNPFTVTFSYAPGLPVMGCRTREQQNAQADQTVFFDTTYAYVYNGSIGTFQEFIPGTIWTGDDSDFFWTTNYFIGDGNSKIFWATNFSGSTGDPIRFTNGSAWANFAPQIDNASPPNLLTQCLCLLPFRGRLVAFNTWEGTSLAASAPYTNRIRWAAIGTPFTTSAAGIITGPTGINATAWRDDIRGQGGFLDIPTSEDIVSVGFVRDNLVIYCENSTWQLRYTGRSIAPFQIEKVNSELGTLSTFGSVQFDTSIVGIGDKGVVECDSYKSSLIDIKIPDLFFQYQYSNNGQKRIQGGRDFKNRLAFWIFPTATGTTTNVNNTYPNQRLIYNYENDSWALFNDYYTALGTFQPPSSRTWLNTNSPWIRCPFAWVDSPLLIPILVAGNQQGFIEKIDQSELTTNDISLTITAITSNNVTPTIITSPNHNLTTGTIIEIYNIPTGTPYSNTLNFQPTIPYNIVFSIIVIDSNTFKLMTYNPVSGAFDQAQLDPPGVYIGGGKISIRDNFIIQSKKLNFLDDGQSIQLGYLDILMDSTGNDGSSNAGAISLNVYLDYNTNQASNTSPMNEINQQIGGVPDTFFNSIIPTTQSTLNTKGGTKFWQRVFCPTRANFLTLQYTFSNAQMAGVEQTTDVQIDAQVLWIRKAGRMTQI